MQRSAMILLFCWCAEMKAVQDARSKTHSIACVALTFGETLQTKEIVSYHELRTHCLNPGQNRIKV